MDEGVTRAAKGERCFEEIVGRPAFPASTPATEAARDFVFAEVWSRPGLDRRSRRWITLACVCAAGSPVAMRTYMDAALRSGDIDAGELHEFVLQFAVFQGFPKAMEAEAILRAVLAEHRADGGS